MTQHKESPHKESPSTPASPSFSVATLSTEGGSPGPEFIVDDIELLTILAATDDDIHADIFQTAPDKRKRDDPDYNFLDQFEFVDVIFEPCKKQKFVQETVEDLTSLLNQSDKLIADLDYQHWDL